LSTSFGEAAGLFVASSKKTQGTAGLLSAVPVQRNTQLHKTIYHATKVSLQQKLLFS
jgi:hypothetical protein